MDNKRLKERMLKELKIMKDGEFIDALTKLNAYNNIKYFTKKKLNVDSFFKACIAEALKRKLRIPSGGYLDLIEMVDEVKKKLK